MNSSVSIQEQAPRMHDWEALHEMNLKASVAAYEIDLSERIEEPVPVVTLDGMTVCSRGNLSAIVGEAKSKKTFLCSALVGGVLSYGGYMGFDTRPCRVVWIDTEQSEAHVHRVIARTHHIASLDVNSNDERLHVLSLRELEPAARAGKAYEAIELYRPDLVVIDGIADLQYNTNDLEESERIVTELMRLSTLHGMHILCVLHTNPNSDKARGHVGSALQRKAETVFYVHRVGQVSVVEPQFCRNEPFERFAFRVDDAALPVLCDLPNQQGENPLVALLRDEYGGAVERPVFVRCVAEREGISLTAAKVRVVRAIKRRQLALSDDAREVTIPWGDGQ